ncbi:MAG TPA: 50S ribosomal protein L3 [Armatimonadota bacterium]|jgi:large subunit ribosomal protein L3
MKAILGTKVGMTQLFAEGGRVVPVTVIEAGPCTVVQKKTVDTDTYEAIQVGYLEDRPRKEASGRKPKGRRVTAPMQGHFDKATVSPKRHLREFRGPSELGVGDEIRVEIFAEGDKVDVIGTSKGKGFAGVVKRYHWHGGDMTHGSMIHRKPQSAGATDPARIFKGTGRPGHMGNQRVTQRGLQVVRVIPEKNLILIKGAVPGPNGGLLTVRGHK